MRPTHRRVSRGRVAPSEQQQCRQDSPSPRHTCPTDDANSSSNDCDAADPQVHAAIRADPVKEKKSRSKPSETKNWKPAKLTYDERKANLKVSVHYLPPHSCELLHSLVSSCGLLP